MAMAMKIKTGNPLRKLVLLKLADNANDQGECWPSIPYLAATCEMAERSVQNHIKWLHEQGFLWVEPRKSKNGGHQSNIYHLTLERRLRSPLEEDEKGDLPPEENQEKNGAAQGAGSAGANDASLSEVPAQQIRQGLSFDSLGVAQPLHPEPIIKNLSLEPIPPLPPNNSEFVEPDKDKTDRGKPDWTEPDRHYRELDNPEADHPERENLTRRSAERMDYGAYLAAYNELVGDRLAEKRRGLFDAEVLKTEEAYLNHVMTQAGFCDVKPAPDGGTYRQRWSIAFANMDQATFDSIYRGVAGVIWNETLSQHFASEAEMALAVDQLMAF